jgi:hypothetical protein
LPFGIVLVRAQSNRGGKAHRRRAGPRC